MVDAPHSQLLHSIRRAFKLALFLSTLVVLASPLEGSRIATSLEKVLSAGKITMISRNGPTTYYEGPEGLTGFEYVLGSAFAKHLGVELEIVEEEDLGLMLNSVGGPMGDFAAAGLSITERRKQRVAFATPYLEVTQKLVYRSGSIKPRTIEDLYDTQIVVIANSSHEENLQRLKKHYPKLRWEVRFDLEMMELLELVHLGEIEHTIVDSNAYDINSPLYPKARIAFDISEPEQLAWAFPKQTDKTLINEAETFFAGIKASGLIEDAKEAFFGHVGGLDYGGSILFTKRLDTRLPKWRDKLKQAADETGLDWQLLAALSYQESHWNPRAVSPTGVKGFMMLTLTTAKEVGVKNRLNADESISGGARYFKHIYDRIPEQIDDPDRTWLALAAYNIGFGHLTDARILTRQHGGNPDKWIDVRESLLLLSKRKYYKYTKHGYARGWEAVGYVHNIRNFYSIIAWHEKNRAQQLALNEQSEPEYSEFSPLVREAVRSISAPSAEL